MQNFFKKPIAYPIGERIVPSAENPFFYKIIKNAFFALKIDSILYILDQKKIIFLAKFKIL